MNEYGNYPVDWLPYVWPRRGGVVLPPLPKAEDKGKAWNKLLEQVGSEVDEVLAAPVSEAEPMPEWERELLTGAAESKGEEAALVEPVAESDEPVEAAETVETKVVDDLVCQCSVRDSPEFAALIFAIKGDDVRNPAGVVDSLVGLRGPAWVARCLAEAVSLEIEGMFSPKILKWRTGYLSFKSKMVEMLARVRRRLVELPDDTEAIALMEPLRTWPLLTRVACSFLVPARHDWFEADLGKSDDQVAIGLQLGAAITVQEATTLFTTWAGYYHCFPFPGVSLAATLLDALGPGLAPVLDLQWQRPTDWDATEKRVWADSLAHIDSDGALRSLLEQASNPVIMPYMRQAMERFPVRAARVLAQAEHDDSAMANLAGQLLREQLLTEHVQLHPELQDHLDEEVRARVTMAQARVPEAGPGEVPAILACPPWVDRPKKVPVVLELTAPKACAVSWEQGERERWLAVPRWATEQAGDFPSDPAGWISTIEHKTAKEDIADEWQLFLALAPLDWTEPHLDQLSPLWTNSLAERIIARQTKPELAAAQALRLALVERKRYQALMVPFVTADIARQEAEWFNLKSARDYAIPWLRRHPRAAAALLIPTALGEPGKPRTQAENVLNFLVKDGFCDDVVAAADQYGTQAIGAVDELVTADPLLAGLPSRIPSPPKWLQFEVLPQVLLRTDGDGPVWALPEAAVRALVAMAQISTIDPYPGVEEAVAALDQTSLAEFARAVFQAWANQGFPNTAGWVLDFQGLAGDDKTVELLIGMVQKWKGGFSQRAASALDAVAAIGTDSAVLFLSTAPFHWDLRGILPQQAVSLMHQVAQGRGLTAEQLGDRAIPDCGLDEDSCTRLDVGDNQFIVSFDQALRPVLTDTEGKRRKSLPKPSGELEVSQAAQLEALKKEVQQTSQDQMKRLEQAMVSQRPWTVDDFMELVRHPLMWNLIRRLVWTDEQGAFRVAEDRTFADVGDTQVDLVGPVRLAHPVLLGPEAVRDWTRIFVEYEIMQPFSQLVREVFTAADVAGLVGQKVPSRVFGRLTEKDWGWQFPRQGLGWDAPLKAVDRHLPGGQVLSIPCDPGFSPGLPDVLEQTLGVIDSTGVDQVFLSEAIRELLATVSWSALPGWYRPGVMT